MIQPPNEWYRFSSDDEQLNWLKSHKLTPQTHNKPKQLYYEGIYCNKAQECQVVGYVDKWTAVISIGEQLHCIHSDYLVEMQAGKSLKNKETLLPEKCDFLAIDFETATQNLNSACEIGIAFVSDLEVVYQYRTLIRPPQNKYDQLNSSIHHITPEDTENEEPFSEHWKKLKSVFGPVPVIAHNAGFDVAVLRACLGKRKCNNFSYIDTMKMVKDIVPGKHGLSNCCKYFNIELENHHNAVDDAIACAEVAIACIKSSGCSTLEEFCQKNEVSCLNFASQPDSSNIFNSETPKQRRRAPNYSRN